MRITNEIKAEDYQEPRCLLCGVPNGFEFIQRIPQDRVMRKMDEYMSRRDYKGAERHLKFWLEEAKEGHDKKGELMVRNELIGHFRKTGNKDAAFEQIDLALTLLDELNYADSLSAGTTYVNSATACNAFAENEKAVELFEKAKLLYESQSVTPDQLLGGLYNNMGLTLVELKRFDEANELYRKALETMKKVQNGLLEQCVTYLNMADALSAQFGFEQKENEIYDLLDKAADCLDNKSVDRDGYYAYVCENCAPGFSFYGYFAFANELKKRAEKIYERA